MFFFTTPIRGYNFVDPPAPTPSSREPKPKDLNLWGFSLESLSLWVISLKSLSMGLKPRKPMQMGDQPYRLECFSLEKPC